MINKSGYERRSKLGHKVAAALAGSALLLTAACGGGSDRPSTAQIEKAMTGGADSVFGSSFSSVPKAGLDCIAKALHDSKLSDAALKAIVDKKKDYKPNKTDNAALSGVQTQLMKCVTSLSK